jgi:hypothetical protein
MKNIISTMLLLFVVCINFTAAADLNFRHKIGLTNDKYPQDPNGRFDKLTFGLDEAATIGLDTALGEMELFPAHPPSGLHAIFEIPETDKPGKIWSYIDIKPIAEEDKFELVYTINMQKDVLDKITFNWQPLPSQFLDSAILCDNVLGTIFRVDMLKNSEAYLDNPGLSKFEIKLWVNKTKTSVEDGISHSNFSISPNPASDYIELSGIGSGNTIGNSEVSLIAPEICIYNLLGVCLYSISELNISQKRIDISSLPAGVYYVRYGSDAKLFVKD